jgi:hypothetical protein
MVIAAAAAITIAMVAGRGSDHAAPAPAAAAAPSPMRAAGDWRRLPPIPEHGAIDAGHLAVSDGAAYVAVQTATTRRTAEVRVWRWDGTRWSGPVGGRTFAIDPDAGFFLTGGGALCLSRTAHRRPLVSCAGDGTWRRLGQEVFPPSDYVVISDAIAGADAPTIISNGIPKPVVAPGGAGYTGHAESRAWTFSANRWQPVSRDEIPGGTEGTQRPDGSTAGCASAPTRFRIR